MPVGPTTKLPALSTASFEAPGSHHAKRSDPCRRVPNLRSRAESAGCEDTLHRARRRASAARPPHRRQDSHVASLSDPFAPLDQSFVDLVAEGYNLSGRWPVWQFVQLHLQRTGADAVEIFRRLPTWQQNYRAANCGSGTVPEPATQVWLTTAGIAHVSKPLRTQRLDQLIAALLASLRLANERARRVEPDPLQALDERVDGTEFTAVVNMTAGTGLSAEQLYRLLSHEPPFWGALRGSEGLWSLEYLKPWISRCDDVGSIEDYLDRIESLVGWPTPTPAASAEDPFALVTDFDHLDLVWRLVAGEPLLRIPRVAIGAKLAREATTHEEFESCLSALADVLSSLNVTGDETGALQKLKGRISELREGGVPGVDAPIEMLRRVTAIRNGAQHQGAAARAVRARGDLGLPAFGTDPATSWRQVRGIAAMAVRQIREELETLLP